MARDGLGVIRALLCLLEAHPGLSWSDCKEHFLVPPTILMLKSAPTPIHVMITHFISDIPGGGRA